MKWFIFFVFIDWRLPCDDFSVITFMRLFTVFIFLMVFLHDTSHYFIYFVAAMLLSATQYRRKHIIRTITDITEIMDVDKLFIASFIVAEEMLMGMICIDLTAKNLFSSKCCKVTIVQSFASINNDFFKKRSFRILYDIFNSDII